MYLLILTFSWQKNESLMHINANSKALFNSMALTQTGAHHNFPFMPPVQNSSSQYSRTISATWQKIFCTAHLEHNAPDYCLTVLIDHTSVLKTFPERLLGRSEVHQQDVTLKWEIIATELIIGLMQYFYIQLETLNHKVICIPISQQGTDGDLQKASLQVSIFRRWQQLQKALKHHNTPLWTLFFF